MTENAEVNLVLSSAGDAGKGVFGSYAKKNRISLEQMKTRDVGVLETDELDFDFEKREIHVRSARGWLPMRFDQLVLEINTVPRVPRALRRCDNVVPWPVGDVAALDTFLAEIRPSVAVVVGSSRQAVELVRLLASSDVPVRCRHVVPCRFADNCLCRRSTDSRLEQFPP
jgi:uncharacterized 2Fe-2S/4Fe-4S cluster protein (DUF4445 family)